MSTLAQVFLEDPIPYQGSQLSPSQVLNSVKWCEMEYTGDSQRGKVNAKQQDVNHQNVELISGKIAVSF